MTVQPTAQDFDQVLDTFLLEWQDATPARRIEIDTVIDILLEEKERRGL